MSFFQIPGNIRQQFTPFVLNPQSDLNLPPKSGSSTAFRGHVTSPQVFSYRHKTNTHFKSGTAKLNFYPSSLNATSIDDDISFKLLYGRNGVYPSKKSLTVADVLNCIPGVQIREFLPDTRLDQCINLFTDMIAEFTKLISGEEDDKANNNQQQNGQNKEAEKKEEKTLMQKIKAVTSTAWYVMKYMIGAVNPNLYDDLSFGTMVPDLPFSSYKPQVYQNNITYPGSFVMAFPFTLYYKLQSCMTTNLYEVPASTSDKRILLSGGGTAGWTDGGDDMLSTGEMRLSGFLSKIPLIGNLANMVLGNIGINYMPWWNANSGTKTKEPEIEIKFDLFNDSSEAAMMNFIFVNTLVSNNKWIQYNMFQHSSSLYDVKIEGVNRLYACAGDFNVTYEGVLRDPPWKWISQLVNTHANRCIDKDAFLQNINNNKIIKIPDVYRVTMKFQSLLPANFNNYIFTYAENSNHLTKYADTTYQPSAVAQMLPRGMSVFAKRVSAVYKADGDANAGAAAVDVNEMNRKWAEMDKQAAAEEDANKPGGFNQI